MSRRCIFRISCACAVLGWLAGATLLACPWLRGQWFIMAFAAAAAASVSVVLVHCQRPLDEVFEVAYQAGRRDMLRELNTARTGGLASVRLLHRETADL